LQEVAQTTKAAAAPTKRQLEYLLFIAKYLGRYGRAPAESDIERHFLVSAPSVNQMMQMLERRGFISRKPGVPRSARICIDLGPYGAC
jgi:repressor LexA